MKKDTKKTTKKSIADVSWGASTASNAISVQGIRAMNKSLSPSSAYQLSVDLRSCISAIATNIAKAKVRLFHRKSGDEIVGGDLYDLIKKPSYGYSTKTFVEEVISYYNLYGELAISVLDGEGVPVAGMLPINPTNLYIVTPQHPRDLGQIEQWRYMWENGTQSLISPRNLVFHKNFNPLSHVRGVSPVLAGVNEISASYYAVRYNKKFFENDAQASHILILPDGTQPEEKEAFKKEYIANHSSYNGNNNRVWVTTGSDIKVQTLDTPVKDGKFLDLQRLTTTKVMQLYKVPAIEAGDYSNTRFDSADAEREMFLENTLMPQMEMLTQVLQTQLVDRYFASTKHVRASSPISIGKRLKNVLDAAREDRVESDVVILIDPDSLPITAKLKTAKLDYALKLQSTFRMTPLAAANEVGIEIEETEASNKVWYPSTDAYIDPEMPVVAPAAPLAATQSDATAETASEDAKEATVEQKAYQKIVDKFIREFRKTALSAMDLNKMFRLAEVDALNKNILEEDKQVFTAIRLAYNEINQQLKNIVDPDERKAVVKAYFNANFGKKFTRRIVYGN